jgi:lysophospholipase L1-like esterase
MRADGWGALLVFGLISWGAFAASPQTLDDCQPTVSVYAALGDSITWGFDTSQPCVDHKDPLMALRDSVPISFCRNSTNYASRIAQALDRGCNKLQFQNLGISGATLNALPDSVSHIPGTVIEQELPHLRADAKFVTLYIGTNDIRTLGTNSDIDLDRALAKFKADYDSALTQIHCRAPFAQIEIANVPDRADLPASTLPVHPTGDDLRKLLTRLDSISRWINQNVINPYASKSIETCPASRSINPNPAFVKVVDLAYDACSYDRSNLKDGLHPNDQGASIIADRFLGVSLPPQIHCVAPPRSWIPYGSGVTEDPPPSASGSIAQPAK